MVRREEEDGDAGAGRGRGRGRRAEGNVAGVAWRDGASGEWKEEG